jgi:hypothetical protein
VEIAKLGKPMEVFNQDVVEGMMRTDGTPVIAEKSNTRTIEEGDVERDPNKQAPAAPPSLKNPGEATEPTMSPNTGQMRPVQFPKPHPDDQPAAQPGANPDDQPPAASPPAASPSPAPPSQFASPAGRAGV